MPKSKVHKTPLMTLEKQILSLGRLLNKLDRKFDKGIAYAS